MLFDLIGKTFNRLTVLGRASNGRCGQVRWVCRCSCGVEKIIEGQTLREGHTKSCGCLNRELIRGLQRCGKNHHAWKGGRGRTKHGYIWVKQTGGKSRFEHVLKMEAFLGRPLEKGETVHHKNGIKDDNKLENLELWATNHAPGQRVSDLVTWAKEILVKYG